MFELMTRFRIGTRLAFAFALSLALLLGYAAYSLRALNQTYGYVQTLYQDQVLVLAQLKEVSAALGTDVLQSASQFGTGALTATQAAERLAAGQRRAEAAWQRYLSTSLSSDEQALVAQAQPLFAQAAPLMQQAAQTLRTLDGQAAGAQTEELERQLYQAVPPLKAKVDRLVDLQLEHARSGVESANQRYHGTWNLTLALLALALLLSAATGWVITRSITHPLRTAVQVAQAVAEGDLSQRIEPQGRDELADLLQSLQTMNAGLMRIVGDVRQASDTIASATAQIATGNADLSARTENQASSLEQTAASMEQITANVNQHSDTVRQATQIVQRANASAAQGGELVGQVVSTMEEISSSSRRIESIIAVIDGIAFQTNILALNAAVEAARAGEQGRGFAVVASEVRTLAQRSSAAAREIKDLIGNSVGKVQAGTALVGQAGQSVQEIVQQVRRVSDLIAEMSAASKEEASAINEIGNAVVQLDQVTQQNAALVEESAAASASLQQQAQHLRGVVGVFRL